MSIFKLIAGPLIGALIGYFTNYIAVKMLFKPHKPVMIGKHRLPFTPGLIPKRKDELAGAIGSAVSDVLLTKEDLAQALPAQQIQETITDSLWDKFCESKESKDSVGQAITSYIPEEDYGKLKQYMEDMLTEKAVDALQKLDIAGIVVEEGTRTIKEKVQGTMLAMMINDQVIQSIARPSGEEISRYIEENGEAKIRSVVEKELEELEITTVGAVTGSLPLEKEQLAGVVRALYETCVQDSIEKMMERIDVAEIVEDKIKAMDIAKLEELILSVMKKELNAIVNLGALIGLVIGCLNLLISLI